jgi:hypothetical protein
MEKYSLNEGNESLKRVLLMMGYDSKKTLGENTKTIFEQEESDDMINKYGKKIDVTIPSNSTSDMFKDATNAVGLTQQSQTNPQGQTPTTANAVDADNDINPNLTSTTAAASTTPATPEVKLSYKDAVTKLQNLLMTNYKADFGKYGADGKLGPLTLTALNNAIKTKLSKTVTEPPKKIESGDDKKTNTITPDNQITPESNVSVASGSIEDWA